MKIMWVFGGDSDFIHKPTHYLWGHQDNKREIVLQYPTISPQSGRN